MRTAKIVIPVGDLDWEEQATSLVDIPPPSEARSPAANRTRRIDKVDPTLLALARGRAIEAAAPAAARVEAPKKADSQPVPPRPFVATSAVTAMPVPQRTDGKPIPPRPLAVRPFMQRPFAMKAPLPRARPALPTHVLGSSSAEIPRSELFAQEIAPSTSGKLPLPTLPKPVLKAPVFPAPYVSSRPPPSSRGSATATMPAPPPEMTGAIILDERMFEEALGGRIHMNGASLIPSNLDLGVEEDLGIDEALEEESAPLSLADADVVEAVADEPEEAEEEIFEPTGTIDVDDAWLEESQLAVMQDMAPESFWMRGKR